MKHFSCLFFIFILYLFSCEKETEQSFYEKNRMILTDVPKGFYYVHVIKNKTT